MVRKRILRRALDLKFKGARPMEHTRTKWLDRYWTTSRGDERAGKKLKRKNYLLQDEIGESSFIGPYKMEMTLEA
jgi:hypothetical protein